MGAEIGATTSIFAHDERMDAYLRATGRSEIAKLADENHDLLSLDPAVESNPKDFFDRVIEIDLSSLEPYIVGPHSPDRARPISSLATEVADPSNNFVDEITTALIGSCTNSSYEDMSRAADIADQAKSHGLNVNGGFMVFNRNLSNYLTFDEDCDFEFDALETLANEREVMVYKHEGLWECMDHERDVAHLNTLWNENRAFWKMWE